MVLLKTAFASLLVMMICSGAVSSELHSLAAKGNNVALSVALRASNLDTEARDTRGDTPLLSAARKGHLKTIKLLVKHGANINAMDNKRRDILNIAITTKNPSLARLALRLGADPKMVTSVYDGGAIIYGAAKGEVEIIRMLIKAGAPLNRINNIGWTALLEVAILGDGSNKYVKIAQMLLNAGADKSIADKDGLTPLDHAKKRGHRNLMKILS